MATVSTSARIMGRAGQAKPKRILKMTRWPSRNSGVMTMPMWKTKNRMVKMGFTFQPWEPKGTIQAAMLRSAPRTPKAVWVP